MVASIKKGAMSLVMVLTLFVSMLGVFPAYAAPEPRYNNTNTTSTDFVISSAGVATAVISYTGYSGITQGASIETKIQKKTLGLFWTNVETWVDSPNTSSYRTTHSVQLSSGGNYRLVVEYTIYGSGGSADIVPVTVVRSY